MDDSVATRTPDAAPIYSPAESIAKFQIDPRFRVEVVASEPTVEAPVAMAFDEDGRIWVVEMRAYMRDTEGSRELEPSGRIVVLEDKDHNGTYETRIVFLEGLVLPRAVAPCHDGALIIAPPDLIFARDTNRDGKADERRVLMTGLGGIDSPEHAANGLLWGIDNWWHLAQHGSELRFDGSTASIRGTPTVGQWGITQDEGGRLYYTPNSEALRVDLFPKHYAARNPDARDLPGINRLASPDQTVWPARTTPGVNRAYMENVLRSDGRLASHTAACGPSLYFASLFPENCSGDAFVCEPAANMLRRLRVTESLEGPVARNAYERAEFLTSTDERFRPVNTCVGPDGALYLVDMHRGVIQHKLFLTPYLKEQIKARGLESPLHLGRIYRIMPTGSAVGQRPALSSASDSQLVVHLSHPDAWWRRTAQRLLVERRATRVAPLLHDLATHGSTWQSRLHALWVLEGIGALQAANVGGALLDADANVRAAGVRLAELVRDDDILARVRTMARDDDPRVRRQVALSAPELYADELVSTLAECVAAAPGDEVLHACAISSVRAHQRDLLVEVLDRGLEKPGWSLLGRRLVVAMVGSRSPEDRVWLFEHVAASANENESRAALLLASIERQLQPTSKKPGVVHLPREPKGWAALSSRRDTLGVRANQLMDCMDWPEKPSPVAAKQPRPLDTRERALFERGERVYSLCYSCHGPDGLGTAGQAPPLAGSALAQASDGVAIRIVLHGLEASTVGSTPYPVMPPVPINDESIAAVLTYVRRAWSNVADPILPERVREVREHTKSHNRPWTRAELEAIK